MMEETNDTEILEFEKLLFEASELASLNVDELTVVHNNSDSSVTVTICVRSDVHTLSVEHAVIHELGPEIAAGATVGKLKRMVTNEQR